jgi:hypothetical protein
MPQRAAGNSFGDAGTNGRIPKGFLKDGFKVDSWMTCRYRRFEFEIR